MEARNMTTLRFSAVGIVLSLAMATSSIAAAGYRLPSKIGRASPGVAAQSVACFGANVHGCPSKPSPGAACKNLPACPVTARLQRRIVKLGPAPNGCDCDPIIRAQFVPSSVRFGATVQSAMRAKTKVVYQMGHGYGLSRETFVSVKRGSGWLVTNIYCTGKPQTTIYSSPLKPCYKQPPS
jgi:hypothetical protein